MPGTTQIKDGLDIAIKITLLVFFAALIVVLIMAVRGVHQRLEAVDKVINKTNDTLAQIAVTARTIQATTKSFQEQFDDERTVMARRNAQLALTAAIQHASYTTLPEIDKATRELTLGVKRVVDNSDRVLVSVNDTLIPATTQTILTTELAIQEATTNLNSAIKSTQADLHVTTVELGSALTKLTDEGRLTLSALAAPVPDIAARLNLLLDNSNAVGHNLAATTAEFPKIAKHARKWQGAITGARLASLLMTIFGGI